MRHAPLLRRVRSGRGVVLTPAKLNLFLEVHSRRGDGFHELETLMVPLLWWDRIRVSIRDGGTTEPDRLVVRGIAVPTGSSNLIRRAADALRRHHPVPPLDIELDKRIPIEAGLGGGSGNAAGTLVLLDELFDLSLP
ncbi:MAG: 4-(cytidine 5'-diphospho)-2-C-methyl-D-erythritol kinase, partial [Planctomycetes bacterium]|nr:4-(cytidine 5'-diphospho)-2-C-methyl-D-erythritol kinase [Planctomycetota bacterium]